MDGMANSWVGEGARSDGGAGGGGGFMILGILLCYDEMADKKE
jgi:hypothetical protein